MNGWPEHISGITTHVRRGQITNAFRYGVDYVLIDPETQTGPALLSRNAPNIFAVHDKNHGGERKHGTGAKRAYDQFVRSGLDRPFSVLLLTQPSCLGYLFNPVSFWLAMERGQLIAVIAEVNNTFGDRHSYLCHLEGFGPIRPDDTITANKLMHVSPFQDVAGIYTFNFHVDPSKIAIRIFYGHGEEGVIATLYGPRRPMSNTSLIYALIRRPFGALRTITLIHWQALILKLKGAQYRRCPTPPAKETTTCSTSANV